MPINIARDGDAFVLTRGDGLRFQLSDEEVLAIAQSATSYRQDILARQHPGAVFATPVVQTTVLWDALHENILLDLRFERGNLVAEMTPARSELLADQFRNQLSEKREPQARH